jgi:hypothetical protein
MFSRTAIAVATLSLFPLRSLALDCGSRLTHVNVIGNVTTLNVSDIKQVGQICMTMTKGGHEVFDDCGALVGKIVSVDQDGTTHLTHTAVFDLRDTFRTQNDVGTIDLERLDEMTECTIPIKEYITQLAWGTGIFRGATIDVTAVGDIRFPPCGIQNTFELTGEACVRR